MVNLSAFIRFHATRTPEAPALIYGTRPIDYRDLWDRVQRAAAWLEDRGVGPGTVVAVFMKNSPAFLELAFATSHLGAVFLPINYRLSGEEVSYILGNAEAHILIADAEFATTLADIPKVQFIDEATQQDIRAMTGASLPVPPLHARKPDDLFRLMYTSGTTDRPKGVMHTYDNFYWKCADHVLNLGISAADRLLCVGPLYHVGAFDLPGIAVLWMGGAIAILREFDPVQVLAAIQNERLTCGWMAPVMLGRILAYEGRDKFDVSTFRWCIGGGERTPEARIRAFTDLFRNGRYIDGYGLTETCSGDTLMEAGKEIAKIGSTGRALAHCEIRICNERGQPLPPRTEGEICIRGPKVTRGYWRDPVKTASSFHGDWFRSGDVGYLDEDGFLYLTDRLKDMIISGGENIASSEVERILFQMPEIVDAAVVGVADQRWGEIPVAVVVLHPGKTLDLESVQAFCRPHLAGFKIPKQLHIRATLPRNPSGKILKRQLRQELTAASQ